MDDWLTDLIPRVADRIVCRAIRLANAVSHVASHSLVDKEGIYHMMGRRGVESWPKQDGHFAQGTRETPTIHRINGSGLLT